MPHDTVDRSDHDAIVVGTDGSEAAKAAVAWAAEEAAGRGLALEIVSAWMAPLVDWSIPGGSTMPMDPTAFEAAARSMVEAAATEVQATMGSRMPVIRTDAVADEAVAGLLRTAEGKALLVVGRRGRGRLARLLIGSVADAVVHHTTVPVAVISGSALPGAGDVVVGVDGSPGGREAFRWAAAEASRLDQKLVVVHGWETPIAVPPGGLAFEPLPRGSHERETDVLIDHLVGELQDSGERVPDIERRAVDLVAPQALIQASVGAGLLVVGSRGRGGFAGLFLGSVSQQCLHHAACSIVVVPSPTKRDR